MAVGTPRDPRVVLALGLIAAGTGACSSQTQPTPATARDSADVRIVVHPASMAGLPIWSLSEPEGVIGRAAEEDPAHQFTQVRGAVRLSDGRIVVGDWGSKEARYFDASGRHLLTVGGAGEGPGEVRFLYAVDRIHSDTLVVGGWPIGSRYWFDEGGDFVRNQSLGPWFPGMLGRTLPDGSLLLDTFEFGSYGNALETWAANGPDEDFRPAGIVERVSVDGAHVDTIAPILGELHHKTGELPLSFAMHALPHTPVGLVAWSASRIFVGHTERPEVRVHSYDGALQTIIRWTAEPVPVRPVDHRAFEDGLMAGLRRPDLAPRFRRWLSEISYPELKPTFAAMISDESGHLWVRPSAPGDASAVSWTVYGPTGVAEATVSVPAHYRLLDVDDTHLLATWKDELDVEYVSSHRVLR